MQQYDSIEENIILHNIKLKKAIYCFVFQKNIVNNKEYHFSIQIELFVICHIRRFMRHSH